jgi:hypothetical protein
MSPEEYAARKAARSVTNDAAKAEQLAKDLDALCALEDEHGEARVYRHDLPGYMPGLPTLVVARAPLPAEYKRFRDMMRRAKDGKAQGEALDLLVAPCRVYPDAATFERLLSVFPGLGDALARPVLRLAEAAQAEEGKG